MAGCSDSFLMSVRASVFVDSTNTGLAGPLLSSVELPSGELQISLPGHADPSSFYIIYSDAGSIGLLTSTLQGSP